MTPKYRQAPTLKLLNETHWMFISTDCRIVHPCAGGRYMLDSLGRYVETVEFSAIPQNIDQVFLFNDMIEGDSLWHHQGGQGDTHYDEVWRRIQ